MELASSNPWLNRHTTLSDGSAQKEYGLTRSDVINGVRTGKLQYREQNFHGNPWFRLLRCEVEALVAELYGQEHLQERKAKNELAQINKALKKLKTEVASLEKRRNELLSILSTLK